MKNKLIMKIKNNFDGFIVVAVVSITFFLCNYVESEACPVIIMPPEYIEGDYEVLNYFLDSLGINLPENFPPELKEYVSEGVYNLNFVEKRVLKEGLEKELARITNKRNKELYFVVFCEYMRNLSIYGRRLLSHEDKVIEWSKEQGLTAGRQYEVSLSFFIDNVYRNIHKEYWKEINKDLEENNNESDTLKSE